MLALPGLVSLVFVLLVRPFDFFPFLTQFQLLYVFFGLAVLGFLADLGRGTLKWVSAPSFWWASAFVLWAMCTVALRAPATLLDSTLKLLMLWATFTLVAHVVTNFEALSKFAGALLACMFIIASVCVHEGMQPTQCIAYQADEAEPGPGEPDGRSCTTRGDCIGASPDWSLLYECERVGVTGIKSVDMGRVRYVGILQDPNETALAVCLGIPLSVARYQRRRGARRWLVALAMILLAFGTVLMSGSRGGQLVFLATVGVYFLKRFGFKGVLAALPLTIPVLLLGGRSGQAAEGSTYARLECAAAGLGMFSHSPLTGVGFGQFTEYYAQTAHNSYLLAPAELGLPGMVLWATIVWIAIKTCLVSVRSYAGAGDEETRNWGIALLSALAGTCAGILFLSFNYHFLLWILFGFAAAYHRSVSTAHPGWRVHIGPKDIIGVALCNLLILGFLGAYLRLRGAM
jgi:hypothetical protein